MISHPEEESGKDEWMEWRVAGNRRDLA